MNVTNFKIKHTLDLHASHVSDFEAPFHATGLSNASGALSKKG